MKDKRESKVQVSGGNGKRKGKQENVEENSKTEDGEWLKTF